MTASSNIDGAAVTIQSCTGAAAQKWTFSGGSVKIFDDKCLDVTNGENVEGVKMQVWTCTGGTNQQFYYTGDYRYADKCFAVVPHGEMIFQARLDQPWQVSRFTGRRYDGRQPASAAVLWKQL
jgi:hypothetical protein